MKFKVHDQEYELAENLTFGEELDITRHVGDGDRAHTLGAIWISIRRVHPKTTVDDLRDAEILVVEDEEGSLPPTNSNGSAGSEASDAPMAPVSIGSHG